MSSTAPSSSPTANASATAATDRLEVSDVEKYRIGSKDKPVRTAACLIIGDEILNGKTLDSNSNYFAKFCFDLGIALKRIEVIADDEAEIVEASRRMVNNYDFVISSGGIGPTHDDITYQSLAKSFNLPLTYHAETKRRMWELSKHRADIQNQTPEQQKARDRMALFPEGEGADVLFVDPQFWVPVVRLEKKLHVLPGIPRIFKALLEGLKPYIFPPAASEISTRILVRTRLPESSIAPFLTALSERVSASDGIKVGSYPKFKKSVTVSLVGLDPERVARVAQEVCKELDGRIIETDEDESEGEPTTE